MIDLQELRKLAEAAVDTEFAYQAARDIDNQLYPGYDEADKADEALCLFGDKASPETIIELLDRLEAAEKVAKAVQIYLSHIHSPLCIGWDDLLESLSAWQKAKEEQ